MPRTATSYALAQKEPPLHPIGYERSQIAAQKNKNPSIQETSVAFALPEQLQCAYDQKSPTSFIHETFIIPTSTERQEFTPSQEGPDEFLLESPLVSRDLFHDLQEHVQTTNGLGPTFPTYPDYAPTLAQCPMEFRQPIHTSSQSTNDIYPQPPSFSTQRPVIQPSVRSGRQFTAIHQDHSSHVVTWYSQDSPASIGNLRERLVYRDENTTREDNIHGPPKLSKRWDLPHIPYHIATSQAYHLGTSSITNSATGTMSLSSANGRAAAMAYQPHHHHHHHQRANGQMFRPHSHYGGNGTSIDAVGREANPGTVTGPASTQIASYSAFQSRYGTEHVSTGASFGSPGASSNMAVAPYQSNSEESPIARVPLNSFRTTWPMESPLEESQALRSRAQTHSSQLQGDKSDELENITLATYPWNNSPGFVFANSCPQLPVTKMQDQTAIVSLSTWPEAELLRDRDSSRLPQYHPQPQSLAQQPSRPALHSRSASQSRFREVSLPNPPPQNRAPGDQRQHGAQFVPTTGRSAQSNNWREREPPQQDTSELETI